MTAQAFQRNQVPEKERQAGEEEQPEHDRHARRLVDVVAETCDEAAEKVGKGAL